MLALLKWLMENLSTILLEELWLNYFILRLTQLYLIVRIISISQTQLFPYNRENANFSKKLQPLRIVCVNLSVHLRNVS